MSAAVDEVVELGRGELLFLEALARGARRDRADSVSECAALYRVLTSVSSSEPGRWQNSRTPYLVEPMDLLSANSPVQRVVLMFGAQLGKTECGNNWILYVVHSAPGPMMFGEPTVELMRKVSKQRIAPMIESSPVLRERVSDARERDSSNTIFTKEFEGGVLFMVGANSAVSLRSAPIRYLFGDEVDLWPGDVGGEGDAVSLAEKRTSTFARRKILLTSTPGTRGRSRIHAEYLRSDQRRYLVPCPECGHFDFITWGGADWFNGRTGHHHWIEFDRDAPEGERAPRLVCSNRECEARIPESKKRDLLRDGKWVAFNPGAKTAGFHLSSLYSPSGWKSWSDCVDEFLEAKGNQLKLKTWVNTVLGEPFDETESSFEPEDLLARAEDYVAEVPAGVGVLVGSADVQANRVECRVYGFGAGERSWLIARHAVYGNPERTSVWHDVDRFFRITWEHESGRRVPVTCVTVDSGGHHTEHVYRFCAARTTRRFFATKGSSTPGSPLISKPSRNNAYQLPLFIVGTEAAKDIVLARVAVPEPGPGYMHFTRSAVDLEFFKQLTAEAPVWKWVPKKGQVRVYEPVYEQNHELDLACGALVALRILGVPYLRTLQESARVLAEAPAGATPAEPPSSDSITLRDEPPRRPRPSGRWMNYRRRYGG